MLTVDELSRAMPERIRKTLNPEVFNNIAQVLSEPDMFEQYRENLLSYGTVLQDGRWTMQEYVAAIKYVSHRLMGKTQIDAYSITFPDKIQRFKNQGVAPKDIASYVTAYNKSKLVNRIFEQTMIPVHVLNREIYQEAINIQIDLARNAKSEKVRADAANSLMTHLKAPETAKVELEVKVGESQSQIAALRAATQELVAQQKLALQSGAMDAQQVARARVVPAEVVDVEAAEVKP